MVTGKCYTKIYFTTVHISFKCTYVANNLIIISALLTSIPILLVKNSGKFSMSSGDDHCNLKQQSILTIVKWSLQRCETRQRNILRGRSKVAKKSLLIKVNSSYSRKILLQIWRKSFSENLDYLLLILIAFGWWGG